VVGAFTIRGKTLRLRRTIGQAIALLEAISVPRARRPLAGTRGRSTGSVKKTVTIGEPAHQAFRPAYAKLDEGCSDRPSRASLHTGRTFLWPLIVPKRAVAIADDGRDGEVRYLGEIDNSPDAVRKLVAKLSRRYQRLHFCYEAGPTGYGLYRPP
jgi:hypothetical protein